MLRGPINGLCDRCVSVVLLHTHSASLKESTGRVDVSIVFFNRPRGVLGPWARREGLAR